MCSSLSRQLSDLALLVALSAAALSEGGCATAGPNHVYLTTAAGPAVEDLGPPPARVDRAVAPGERVLGLAYDYNTDHLFLRLAPTQVIRVIERPSGKILREMPLPAELHTGPLPRSAPEAPAPADEPRASEEQPSADLAIRSSDRHLFAVYPDGRAIAELTLFGKFVRRIEPAGLAGPIGGLAYDQRGDRLLLLTVNAGQAQVGAVGSDGNVTYYVTFPATVAAVSLGYDSDARHYFVPLADGAAVGEFDATGRLVAAHPTPGHSPVTALDAGPRSFVRVF